VEPFVTTPDAVEEVPVPMAKKGARRDAHDDVRGATAGTVLQGDDVPVSPPPRSKPALGLGIRRRPVIERIRPQVEGGVFPAKAVRGDALVIEADAFADGHDVIACEVRLLGPEGGAWDATPMTAIGQDRWRAVVVLEDIGEYRFTVSASVDTFSTWLRDLRANQSAGKDVSVDLAVGSALVRAAATRVGSADGRLLGEVGDRLDSWAGDPAGPSPDQAAGLDDPEVLAATRAAAPPEAVVTSAPLAVVCDPEHARFASWYELFPRSASPDPDRAGTLADVVGRLDYLESLNVDILYLPPIHPIGHTNRKGRDNSPSAGPGDPGSPWAIGSEEGGHCSVHPDLGTLADFDLLVSEASRRGIRIALDLAFQCSPDHPWVREHPDWFRHLPDGSIRFAENPPKRYEDIYPIDFDNDDWRALWAALAGVVWFWIGHGVTVFRVDNPHTKPFGFWQWLITSVKAERPEVVFLSEAFTRPTVMDRLAKVGFTQSYTYFTWRTSAPELTEYLTELTRTERADFFGPNFWPNTPDILPVHLQSGTTATFVARLVLAATLSASYGIFGPAFELKEHRPTGPGAEEYADSEKYGVRHWDLDRPDSLAGLVSRVNDIRRRHRALQRNASLRFHPVDNPQLLAYTKCDPDPTLLAGSSTEQAVSADTILTVVNLDPYAVQGGWVTLDLDALGLAADQPYEVHDLLTDARYRWRGPSNFVQLDPDAVPAHIFMVHRPDGAATASEGR
jgi:starch synthase (maltosyl-transferring)